MAETVPFTVSDALSIAKDALRVVPLTVVGEVSGFKPHSTYSAFYFQLKDESSVMSVTLWKNVYERTGVELRDGMVIEMAGHFDIYAAKGSISFIPHRFKIAGEGDLRAQVAALAEKLRLEGLMDEGRKKDLPWLPQRIAVITSANGAAIHDVLQTLARRYPIAEVLFFGTLVEGHEAARGVVEALQVADGYRPDVILLVRGGGSFEDLLPFSAEEVARAIASCETPVVTGIGHEPDFSIADMVADLRASTPTAAAESVVPDKNEISEILAGCLARMEVPLDQYALHLDGLQQLLEQALPARLERNRESIDALKGRLETAIPTRLARDALILHNLHQRFSTAGTRLLERPRTRLTARATQLEALSPLAVLARGYAAVFNTATHEVVDSICKVDIGAELTVQVADGSILTTVQRVDEGVVS